MFMETITQRIGLAAGIAPQVLNAARLSSDGVDMSKFKRVLFVLSMGALNSGSISAWLQESASASSGYTANDTAGAFANSGANNVSQTAMTTDNNIVTFEVRADQLTTGKRYVRLQIKETATHNANVCVVAYGDEADSKPGNANNATAVATPQNVVS